MSATLLDGGFSVQALDLMEPGSWNGEGLFRTDDGRGRFALFADGVCLTAAEFIEFAPGAVRGNHVHARATEIIYLALGEIECRVARAETGEGAEVVVVEGSLMTFRPGIAHAFRAREHSIGVAAAIEGDLLRDMARHPLF